MQNNKLLAILATGVAVLCGCGNGSINDSINKQVALNKRTFIDFPAEFKMISMNDAKSITDKSHIKLNSDLSDVFEDWKSETCRKSVSEEINQKCKNNGFSISDMFADSIQVAQIDLNKDGKRDLILYFGGKTGRAGLGNCGVAEYRFYKNTGTDFIPIGRANTTQNATLNILDDAKKNQFMTLVWKYKTDCEGNSINKQDYQKFDTKKSSY